MRLADFILANMELILREWEEFARSLSPGATMKKLELRDHADAILRACVRDMRTAQSATQQTSKAKGLGGAGGAASELLDEASTVHALDRVGSGFDLDEVVAEYRSLRASVVRLWRQGDHAPDSNDLDDITRFSEALDQSLATAVTSYTHRVDQSRRMFLAILGHDLRNPLNCIGLSAQLALYLNTLDETSTEALSKIQTSVDAISRLIKDLLDFAATGLGGKMPLVIEPVDLEALGREVLAELHAAHPTRTMLIEVQGDLTCDCDSDRMRQAFSNLLGNALQHGSENGAVELSLSADGDVISVAVRNQGTPISHEVLPTIFDPLVRGMSKDEARKRHEGSIGLGLYIVNEIVTSHEGTVEVSSSAESGTVFTIHMPRHQPEL